MLVRAPSPPELPLLDSVSVALTSCLTFVAVVPSRKNVTSSVKGIGDGCSAWIVAVTAAERMPIGVRDLRRWARMIRARVAGTAIMARMAGLVLGWCFCEGFREGYFGRNS